MSAFKDKADTIAYLELLGMDKPKRRQWRLQQTEVSLILTIETASEHGLKDYAARKRRQLKRIQAMMANG